MTPDEGPKEFIATDHYVKLRPVDELWLQFLQLTDRVAALEASVGELKRDLLWFAR